MGIRDMKKYLSGFARASFIITAVSAIVYAIALDCVAVADFLNGTLSVAIRFILSSLSYPLPFSVFELLVVLSPVILILTVVILVRRASDRVGMIKSVFSLLAVIALIFTSYIFTLGIGYHTTSVSEKTGIEDDADITAEELYSTVTEVISELNAHASLISLTDGETVMPYSVDEMSARLIEAYDVMNAKYSLLTNYTSPVKKL